MNITKKLECPSTWDIDEKLISQYDESNELEVSVQSQPVMSLMQSVMITEAKIKQGNYEEAERNLQKTEKIWNEIMKSKQSEIKDDNISLEVLLHIKEATKCFLLEKINRSEANKILDIIKNANDFKSKIEIATVEGCKSVIWLNFHEHAIQKTMLHAKLACDNSPYCSLWHFIIAKALRSSRRLHDFTQKITKEEIEHLFKSYELLQIPYYAINVAETCRDIDRKDEAQNLYEEIYSNKQQLETGILLRLVKGFISFENFEKAKDCLDSLEKSIPDDPAFLHYKGLYFEKKKMYNDAIINLEKAIIMNNKSYMAEKTYIRCMIKGKKANFEAIDYLKTMLKKYDGNTKQVILLDIGFNYYHRKKDICNAAYYLWESIKLNPDNKCFKNYYNLITRETINVFEFIKKDLLPKLEEYKYGRMQSDQSIVQDLKDFCVQ